MEKDMIFVVEGVNAAQDFVTLEQLLQIVQQAAQKLGALKKLPQIVQYTADKLKLYQNLKEVNGHLIGDFDVYHFLDENYKILFRLIRLMRYKSYFREALIDDDFIKLAIDISCKACLLMGFETGIIKLGQTDPSKFEEQKMYVNIINEAFSSLDEYISKSYKDNKIYEFIKNSVKKFNLKNILESKDIKYYNFYHELLLLPLESYSNSVFLATRVMFGIGFMAGQKYVLSQKSSQYLLQELGRMLYSKLNSHVY